MDDEWLAGWIISSSLHHPDEMLCVRYTFPKSALNQNHCPEFTLHLLLKLHFADALSNMNFGRWKNLMIKGTRSDFHLNYNLTLIFYCLSLICSSLGLQLQYLSPHSICIYFLFTPILSILSFVLHFFFLVFSPLIVWSLLFLSFYFTCGCSYFYQCMFMYV